MEKRYDIVERTLYLIRKLLEKNLPKEAILNEMIEKRNELLQKFIK
jgi:hypothetical protein